ncbi:oligopeptide transport system ATP-binding protein [Cribrihabitans marinus]|uniref:Oligopeptide transport system ATP-binding protein n=1 Tax=Cribrihabitans marinus TaxID=1227549 RepID=A0A1H7DZ47_9RHOB|nr:ABC transporter ATP-binding protein [Cribrihabitans marinus]GGH39985.1 ABC transporter ATP-binding protein [Cribrihabitans marinus]SEK04600.1 oligopeptide transport system ATP-binding protein [Cribrihabitans marinus]
MTGWLEIRDLSVDFPVGGTRRNPVLLHALRSVDISVPRGSVFGIVGESGCGKSTLARVVGGLTDPTSGEVSLEGQTLGAERHGADRRRIQMVFQDPGASLNPAMSVRRMLTQLLRHHRLVPDDQIDARLAELMAMVNMPRPTLDRHPRALSGGQRQRIAIARALALEPEILIADEPTSALDVSVQASVLNLLRGLVRDLGMTMIFISHDLATVRHICDEVAVMYLGRIVERAPTGDLFTAPRHPYTGALMSAVPRIGAPARRRIVPLDAEQPSPMAPIEGCAFHNRCPLAVAECAAHRPPLNGTGHAWACHNPLDPEPEEDGNAAR